MTHGAIHRPVVGDMDHRMGQDVQWVASWGCHDCPRWTVSLLLIDYELAHGISIYVERFREKVRGKWD